MIVVTATHDDGVVALDVPASANSVLGHFDAAKRIEGSRYVLPATQVDALSRIAAKAGETVYDRRDEGRATVPPPSPRRRSMPLPLPECSNCGAPYRRTFDPPPGAACPACGYALRLVQHEPDTTFERPR